MLSEFILERKAGYVSSQNITTSVNNGEVLHKNRYSKKIPILTNIQMFPVTHNGNVTPGDMIRI